jgi:hypothetical protein
MPGGTANPNGRPKKGCSISETVREAFGETPERKKELVEKIIAMALQGDIAAIRLIWNYMDGMPKQSLEGVFDVKKDGAAELAAALMGEHTTANEPTEDA